MDYLAPVAGGAMLRWIVLVVGAHPVPPTVSVAWICGPHESARSAAQAHLNMDAFGHRHSVLPRWWRRELHRKIRNGWFVLVFFPYLLFYLRACHLMNTRGWGFIGTEGGGVSAPRTK